MNQALIITAISYFCNFIEIMILLRVILSWLPISKNNVLVRIIYSLTEPILEPIRNLIYKSPLGGPGMVIDFSPILVLFLIDIIKGIIISLIIR